MWLLFFGWGQAVQDYPSFVMGKLLVRLLLLSWGGLLTWLLLPVRGWAVHVATAS